MFVATSDDSILELYARGCRIHIIISLPSALIINNIIETIDFALCKTTLSGWFEQTELSSDF